MKDVKNYLKKDLIIPTILVIVILIFVSVTYFNSQTYLEQKFYSNSQFKTSFLNGDLKIFAYSDTIPGKISEGSNSLSNLEGYNGIILGSAEAKMMREENLFQEINSRIDNFFGVNIYISGILKPTGTIIDDMHFLDYETFNKLDGEDNLYTKFSPEGMPKLFYYKEIDSEFLFKAKLIEGDLSNYKMTVINDNRYYPVLIGYDEAKMMREEGLFKDTGDIINDFFGYNIVVVGVFEKSNTGLDMIHIVPFK